MMKGKWEEALEHLLVSHRALPDNADLNAWIGLALTRLERKEEAAPYLRRALETDPKREDARRLLEQTTRDR
jgi:tetratricopeptide (TPR) repeat protein